MLQWMRTKAKYILVSFARALGRTSSKVSSGCSPSLDMGCLPFHCCFFQFEVSFLGFYDFCWLTVSILFCSRAGYLVPYPVPDRQETARSQNESMRS